MKNNSFINCMDDILAHTKTLDQSKGIPWASTSASNTEITVNLIFDATADQIDAALQLINHLVCGDMGQLVHIIYGIEDEDYSTIFYLMDYAWNQGFNRGYEDSFEKNDEPHPNPYTTLDTGKPYQVYAWNRGYRNGRSYERANHYYHERPKSPYRNTRKDTL